MPPDRGCGRRRGDSEAPQTATQRAYRVTAMVELKLFKREREREERGKGAGSTRKVPS